jgi:hypothetical protein
MGYLANFPAATSLGASIWLQRNEMAADLFAGRFCIIRHPAAVIAAATVPAEPRASGREHEPHASV